MRTITKKNKSKDGKYSRGFTLIEILTTIAIIGLAASLAIPNFLRIRMNTNMELVRQHMRVIGEKMTEIMGKTGKFPDEESWGSENSTDPDELAITASLSAIDTKDYTTDEYTTSSNRGNYQFRSCPEPGKWGSAGDRCFLLTPSGISEMNDPAVQNTFNFKFSSTRQGDQPLENILGTETDTAKLLKFLEDYAYINDIANLQTALMLASENPEIPSFSNELDAGIFNAATGQMTYGANDNLGHGMIYVQNYAGFQSSIKQIYGELYNKGLEVTINGTPVENIPYMPPSLAGYTSVNIGLRFIDPNQRITSNEKLQAFCSSRPSAPGC